MVLRAKNLFTERDDSFRIVLAAVGGVLMFALALVLKTNLLFAFAIAGVMGVFLRYGNFKPMKKRKTRIVISITATKQVVEILPVTSFLESTKRSMEALLESKIHQTEETFAGGGITMITGIFKNCNTRGYSSRSFEVRDADVVWDDEEKIPVKQMLGILFPGGEKS